MRCVSIDGTLYDPDGAITGGKDINKKPDIQQLKKLIETKKIELERLRNNIDKRNQREIERAKELEKLFKKKNGDD